MSNARLQLILVWMLIIAVGVFLLERLVVLTTVIATPLLLFGLAWLVALMLKPLVDSITQLDIPIPFITHRSVETGVVAPTWRMPRNLAVSFIYVAMLAILVYLGVSVLPVVGRQIARVESNLGGTVDELSRWITQIELEIERLGYRGDLERIVQPETLAEQATTIGSSLAQQSLDLASRVFTVLIDVVLVLMLSFYMTLDGPRIAARIVRTIPEAWREDTVRFFTIVNSTFGGFLRSQFLQGTIYGLATAVVMTIFGASYVALASVIAAIVVLIPIIGGILGIIPPLLVVLIEQPDNFVWVLLIFIVIQQILFNVIMPRLISRSVGLHPLLVFAALLVGAAVAGGWGILFGIPLAGVAASVLQFVYGRATGEEPAAPPAVTARVEKRADPQSPAGEHRTL